MKYSLGSKVRHKYITVFSGFIMARTEYLTQVTKYGILPLEPKDGVPSDLFWYNEEEMSEIHLQKLIVDWLNLQGHRVWIAEVPQGMKSKYSPTGRRKSMNRGAPDIVGSLKDGRAIFIEVKQERDRKRITEYWEKIKAGDYRAYMQFKDNHVKEQAEFLNWLRDTGALCMFCFSLEDIQQELRYLTDKVSQR